MDGLIGGLLLVFAGVLTETLVGSFRHFFDWRWPRRRYPVSPENVVRVLAGRLFLVVGVIVLVVGSIATVP